MLKAGLDWAKETHALCVIDEQGQRVLEAEIPHTAQGLAKMLCLLARLAPLGQIPIAIERPSGLIVDALVEAGCQVVPIHPNVLKATRSRYRAAGGKSDPGDAYILADLLRTDGHRFGTLQPLSDEVRALRALARTRDDLVAARVALANQLRKLTSQLEKAVAQLPAGQVIMSFPRAGKVNAAQILAELGEDPSRFPTEAHLAAEGGVAPVTYASGKYRGVVFRFACNHRLRKALTGFADNSRHASPWARHLYAKARARGCDHPHAVRILARAWVRVLWKAWSDGLPYDPAKHGAAAKLAV